MQFEETDRNNYELLPLVLFSIGENERQPPLYRLQGFEYHEFIWIKGGSGTFTLKNDSYFLTEGKGVFIRKGVPHSYVGDPLHTRWCTFSADDRIVDYALRNQEYLLFDCPAFLEDETDALIKIVNSSGNLMARSSAGYSYVSDLFRKITESSVPKDVKIAEFLETHYAEPLTLDDIAAAVEMDKYVLCHYYRENKGMSVMEHLKKLRIAKAKRFLRYGSENIAKVGSMCGFENPSYFIKRFREECGCTPKEYRERKK